MSRLQHVKAWGAAVLAAGPAGLALLAPPAAAQAGGTRLPGAATPAADSVAAATREYHVQGTARTIVEGDFETFPYGHSQPTLTCAVLRACVIQLQPGEAVLSRITGDNERWEITPAPSGADGRTVLVVVKPRDCDITTNLLLATDRRLYDLTLDSPPCKSRSTNPQGPYVRHVRFYYPDETVASWSRPAPVRVASGVTSFNFDYRTKKDKQFPWKPDQVFDDGARTYIKLPESARHGEAPALFVLEPDGSKTLLNYTLADGDTYVTDRLFERAVMVMAVKGKERKLELERRGDPKP